MGLVVIVKQGGVYIIKNKKNTGKKLIIVFAIWCVLCLTSCYHQREKAYYSQKDNFISVTAEITNINVSAENGMWYLGFKDLPDVFSDNCFKIIKENCNIIVDNGGNDALKQGDNITFVTAPRYFGDGYVMPIVAVYKNGEALLEFDEGYENFMKKYELPNSNYFDILKRLFS